MALIDQIIQREVNPFDPLTFKSGNFWQDETQIDTVASIHQEAIEKIQNLLAQVNKDCRSRSILLTGDTGSGKSYLLKRLKKALNEQAIFVYIPPFSSKDHTWRHTLRYLVDSLMRKPEGKNEPQLIIWLKSFLKKREPNFIQKLLGERRNFIKNLKAAYPLGIYNPDKYFSVLYDLIKPANSEIYALACEWLRGDDLAEENLAKLGVKSIDNEDAARGIVANFGIISQASFPIVLCFDQVESNYKLSDNTIDIQPAFTVNTIFHNENLNNFLIIISIITEYWQKYNETILSSDKDRIEQRINLNRINLEQAEALWASRLYPLYSQANPQPESSIYPLNQTLLEQNYPGGKTTPRDALILASKHYLKYKENLLVDIVDIVDITEATVEEKIEQETTEDITAAFKLTWLKELQEIKQEITKISKFSSVDLTAMLRQVMTLFAVKDIKPKFLSSKTYEDCSFSYYLQDSADKLAVIWAEQENLLTLYHIMNACQKAIQKKPCKLHLIRAEKLGKPGNNGYKIYKQIFTKSNHRHIKPTLDCVHSLATYNQLLKSVKAGELIVASKILNLNEFINLVGETQVLHDCILLQNLLNITQPQNKLDEVKDFLYSQIKVHKCLSVNTLIDTAIVQFNGVETGRFLENINQLSRENKIKISGNDTENQIVFLVNGK